MASETLTEEIQDELGPRGASIRTSEPKISISDAGGGVLASSKVKPSKDTISKMSLRARVAVDECARVALVPRLEHAAVGEDAGQPQRHSAPRAPLRSGRCGAPAILLRRRIRPEPSAESVPNSVGAPDGADCAVHPRRIMNRLHVVARRIPTEGR